MVCVSVCVQPCVRLRGCCGGAGACSESARARSSAHAFVRVCACVSHPRHHVCLCVCTFSPYYSRLVRYIRLNTNSDVCNFSNLAGKRSCRWIFTYLYPNPL